MTSPSDIVRKADRLRGDATKIDEFRKALSSSADVYVKSGGMIRAALPAAVFDSLGAALAGMAAAFVAEAEALESRIRLIGADHV